MNSRYGFAAAALVLVTGSQSTLGAQEVAAPEAVAPVTPISPPPSGAPTHEVVVRGRRTEDLLGSAVSASQGAVGEVGPGGPAAAPPRRAARDRPRYGRHPALGGREGEPVFSARVQPRSRHRLRLLRRRRAGQSPQPRARAGLLGSQLPDPRAGRRDRLQEGAVLSRGRRLLRRGRGQHSPREQPSPRDRQRATRDVRVRARAPGRQPDRSVRARCSTPSSTTTTTGPGICRRIPIATTVSCATTGTTGGTTTP